VAKIFVVSDLHCSLLPDGKLTVGVMPEMLHQVGKIENLQCTELHMTALD
jgi:hypothetical protein